MTLHLERVPLDSARLPAWLERYLVGDHLGELIEELVAVRPTQDPFDFDRWFAAYRDQILSSGLAKLPRKALRQLFAHPPALRQLQAAVLVGGGQYWDAVPRSKGFRKRMKATRPAPPPAPAKARTPLPPRPAPRPLPPEPAPDPVPLAVPPVVKSPLPTWVIVAAVAGTIALSIAAVVVVLVLTNRGG